MAENTEQVLDRYALDANGMRADIEIIKSADFVLQYKVTTVNLSTPTKLLLNSFRPELLSMVFVDTSRIQDAKYIEELNTKYIEASKLLIDRYMPGASPEIRGIAIAYILNMMLGLGELEILLVDDRLEEIAVNGSKDFIWIFHKQYGWCKTSLKPPNEESIYYQSEQIGRRIGREINNLMPLMDAELPDGSRVNSTLFPISQSGNTITIRKFSKNPWTMAAMVKNHTVDVYTAALIWTCIQNEISLLIAGGTASGKTSFLNACSIFFPANRRIISVEETRELTLPRFLQWVPMVTRQPNPEGKGEVTLYALMINALRQRPDIMLVGEVRTSEDAQVLFEAIHTGHAVYGTLHADNAQDTITRLTNPPINIPKITLNALGGLIVNFRHRARGIRRVLEFGEVLDSGDANVIYRWRSSDDTFARVSEITRMRETLTLYSGMDANELSANLEEKAAILRWMAENNVMNVDDAGYVVANYYANRQKVLDAVTSKAPFTMQMFSGV